MGPTGAGKTQFAETIAERVGAQLVSADAFQIYRGFNIGTAKTSRPDLYRLIDIRDPHESFGVGEWVLLAHEILAEAFANKQHVVIVGGTGFYVRALLEEYSDLKPPPDPQLRADLERREIELGLHSLVEELLNLDPNAADRVDLHNPVRVRRALERLATGEPVQVPKLPPFSVQKVLIDPGIEKLRQRIVDRFEEMVQNGWVSEVEALRQAGVTLAMPAMRAIGYRALWEHCEMGTALADVMPGILVEMHQYAKRQRTWLRSEPNLVRAEEGNTIELRQQYLNWFARQ